MFISVVPMAQSISLLNLRLGQLSWIKRCLLRKFFDLPKHIRVVETLGKFKVSFKLRLTLQIFSVYICVNATKRSNPEERFWSFCCIFAKPTQTYFTGGRVYVCEEPASQKAALLNSGFRGSTPPLSKKIKTVRLLSGMFSLADLLKTCRDISFSAIWWSLTNAFKQVLCRGLLD